MEPSFTRLYVKHVLLILIGFVPILLVWKVPHYWIAVPVVALSFVFILVQLSFINNVADRQLAHARFKRTEAEAYAPAAPAASTTRQKWVYNTFVVTVGILICLITFTGKKVENYLAWHDLLVDMLKLLWLPFVCAWWYHKRKVVFTDKEKEDYMLLYAFLIPLLSIFHGLVWYNHLRPSKVIATQKQIVADKSSNTLYASKYVFLVIDGTKKRFELPEKVYSQIRPKDTVIITVKEGALGYSYISAFRVLPFH